MRAASGFSRQPGSQEATREVIGQITAGIQPHTLWLVPSHHHSENLADILAVARQLCPEAKVIAGTGYGAISDRGESEEEPGMAGLGLADRELLLLAHDDPEKTRGAEVAWLFLDSTAGWPESVAEKLDAALVCGGGVNGDWGRPAALIDDKVGHPEAWTVSLQGANQVEWTLSQALAPQGKYWPIDRQVGDRLLTLEGLPAAEAARLSLGEERYQAWLNGRQPLFLRVPRGESGRADRVYSCTGLDAGRQAIFVPGLAEDAPEGAFAVLDGAAAQTEFRTQLQSLKAAQPAFAIYVNCCGRGQDLYGRLDVDAEIFAETFPGVPMLGVSSSFELAPRDGGARLCSYTGILVLVS